MHRSLGEWISRVIPQSPSGSGTDARSSTISEPVEPAPQADDTLPRTSETRVAEPNGWLSATTATLVVGLFVLVGTVLASCISTRAVVNAAKLNAQASRDAAALQVEATRKSEEERFEGEAILQAITGKTQEQAVVALKFLAHAGLIPDHPSVLALATEDHGAAVPFSPPQPPQSAPIQPYWYATYAVINPGQPNQKIMLPGFHCQMPGRGWVPGFPPPPPDWHLGNPAKPRP